MKNVLVLFKLLICLLLVVACGDTEKKKKLETTIEETSAIKSTKVLLDATAGGISAAQDSAANKYTYFSFKTGKVINLSDAEAKTSVEWDIALKRTSLLLNGGISGPGTVSGYCLKNNQEAYDNTAEPILSWFENVDSESEIQELDEVTINNVPVDASFETDMKVRAILGDGSSESWWLYDPATHTVSANNSKFWVIKSSSGETYAKMKVASIAKSVSTREISVDFYIQNKTDVAFSDTTSNHVFNIPIAGGSIYYDFDTATETDATSADWDVQFEYDAASRSYHINLNSGISGSGKAGAFGPFTNENEINSSADIPFYVVDKSGGVFVNYPWYAYNLKGNHELWPNYRVYIIKTEDATYKMQISSYYHETSLESGWVTLYFDKLEK